MHSPVSLSGVGGPRHKLGAFKGGAVSGKGSLTRTHLFVHAWLLQSYRYPNRVSASLTQSHLTPHPSKTNYTRIWERTRFKFYFSLPLASENDLLAGADIRFDPPPPFPLSLYVALNFITPGYLRGVTQQTENRQTCNNNKKSRGTPPTPPLPRDGIFISGEENN